MSTSYYVNDGTRFLRSTSPMNIVVDTSGSALQTANPDGTVSLYLTNATGYADNGVSFDVGQLGAFNGLLLQGSGASFGLNLWFDVNGDGEYFVWNGNQMTTTGADEYILGPNAANGVLQVNGSTQFNSLNPGGGNFTLDQLKAGAAAGITAATPVRVWAGLCCGGTTNATLKSLNVSTGPIMTVYVNPTYTDGNAGGHIFGVDAFTSIQAGIDAVAPGGTVEVFPGSYSETASNRFLFNNSGPYQFGLFLDKDGITVQGVDANGSPITDYNTIQALVTTNSTANFGPDGVFVQADHDTITGLEFLPNVGGDNKTIEIIGDDFNLKSCHVNVDGGGSVYINDWRYDKDTAASYIKSYTIAGNWFDQAASLDVNSGAGVSGPAAGRLVQNNKFTMNSAADWAAVSYTGADTGVGWFLYPVGGATILGNDFSGGAVYIRARGTYDNTQFNWGDYFTKNTFDKAVVVGANPPSELTAYSYSKNGGTFNNTRQIGAVIQTEVNHAQPGDTVLVSAGTFDENVVIATPLTLQGAGSTLTHINGVNTGTNDSTVSITASGDVTVKGFAITNAPTTNTGDLRFGVLTNSPVTGVTYTITDNKVIGTNGPDNEQDYGIYGQNGGKENLVISHNAVTQTGANNIVVETHQGTTTISYNTLDAGSFGTDAIFIMTHSGSDVSSKQTVSYNTIDMGTGTNTTSGATGITFATVAGTYGVQPAKYLANSIEISYNVVQNLKANRRGIGFWNDAATGHAADGDILSPLVANNSVEAIPGSPAGSMGIDTIGQVTDATITNNAIANVEFCYKERVWNDAVASGTLLNLNSFVSCTGGVITARTSGLLNATQNWWGSRHGPTTAANPGGDGQPVSDNAAFSPWLCDGTDTQPAVTGFQPAAGRMCAIPTKLVFTTQPGSSSPNTLLNPQPVVEAQDDAGNLGVNFTGDVALTLKINPVSAVLQGTTTVAAVDGVAAFTDLMVTKPGKGFELSADTANPVMNGLSGLFDIGQQIYLPVVFH